MTNDIVRVRQLTSEIDGWLSDGEGELLYNLAKGVPSRQYGRDPYGGYYEDDFILFPVENEDDRIHPKTVVFGVEIDGVYKAYREDELKQVKVIEDTVGGVNIRIEREDAGTIMVTNLDTGEEIVAERGFWFAWYAFHPETELFGK